MTASSPGRPSPAACVGGDGLWRQVLRAPPSAVPRGALFLDRDGTIVEEVGHLRDPDEVRLVAGAAAAIAAANAAGLLVVIVTNQSGIGRRLFGWEDFAAVQERMAASLAAEGAVIDAVLACPHHARALPPYDHPDHPARKPNPGLLLAAAEALPIDLARSWIVGDRAGDIGAGRNAGLAGGLQVATGYGLEDDERTKALALAGDGYHVLTAASLADAPALLPVFREVGAAVT